jgi:hypothetical protein
MDTLLFFGTHVGVPIGRRGLISDRRMRRRQDRNHEAL